MQLLSLSLPRSRFPCKSNVTVSYLLHAQSWLQETTLRLCFLEVSDHKEKYFKINSYKDSSIEKWEWADLKTFITFRSLLQIQIQFSDGS